VDHQYLSYLKAIPYTSMRLPSAESITFDSRAAVILRALWQSGRAERINATAAARRG